MESYQYNQNLFSTSRPSHVAEIFINIFLHSLVCLFILVAFFKLYSSKKLATTINNKLNKLATSLNSSSTKETFVNQPSVDVNKLINAGASKSVNQNYTAYVNGYKSVVIDKYNSNVKNYNRVLTIILICIPILCLLILILASFLGISLIHIVSENLLSLVFILMIEAFVFTILFVKGYIQLDSNEILNVTIDKMKQVDNIADTSDKSQTDFKSSVYSNVLNNLQKIK